MAGRLASEWEGGVELKRNNSKSGYYGVIPAGKREAVASPAVQA